MHSQLPIFDKYFFQLNFVYPFFSLQLSNHPFYEFCIVRVELLQPDGLHSLIGQAADLDR